MISQIQWPDFFFWQVPDTIAGFSFFAVACILTIWGIALIMSAPRRASFAYALGWFMISDCMVYSILGASVLREPGGIDLWTHALVFFVTFTAIAAFILWAREKVEGGAEA